MASPFDRKSHASYHASSCHSRAAAPRRGFSYLQIASRKAPTWTYSSRTPGCSMTQDMYLAKVFHFAAIIPLLWNQTIELPIHLPQAIKQPISSKHPHILTTNPQTHPPNAPLHHLRPRDPRDRSNHQSRLLRARPNDRLQQVRPRSLHSPNRRGIAHKLPRLSSHRARPLSGGHGGSGSS
jgi:hypothetical protein